MNQEQIERTLKLHKLAYGLLMWLKDQTRKDRSLVEPETVEAISSAQSCEEWLAQRLAMIPAHLHPAPNDFTAFTRLFSSFFTTSFRVGQVYWGERAETTVVAGVKELHGRRHKKHSERRTEQAATELKRLALTALAETEGLPCDALLTERAVVAEAVAQDLSLWTYVRELVRRTEFASQGPGVHRLWLALDERTRKNLSVEAVWQARLNLIRWLTKESGEMAMKKEQKA
jgi:hypothetical protein